ncbi:hypothetical protein PSHT_00235 [Puccinia striiformis]|uniref:Uncharacterized protein n=1 Tax=Puccinia striiformis TaxID=27350 RepID=A0A2S4WNL0_9BASI|nr:hypothetical protein PSHT_00235 [Puccinia striiformis]
MEGQVQHDSSSPAPSDGQGAAIHQAHSVMNVMVQAFCIATRRINENIDELAGFSMRRTASPAFDSHFHRITTRLFPPLPGKLKKICDSLIMSSNDSQKDEVPIILAVLVEVKNTIDQITLSTTSFWAPDKDQNGAENEYNMISLRCQAARMKILNLIKDVDWIITAMYFTQRPRFEVEMILGDEFESEHIADFIWLLRDGVDEIAKWSEISDLGFLQERCQVAVEQIEEQLHYALDVPRLNTEIHYEPLRESITIIKLSRIFLNKIKRSNHINKPDPLSEMRHDQLLVLLTKTLVFPEKLEDFISNIEYHYEPERELSLTEACNFLHHFRDLIDILAGHLSEKGTTITDAESSQDICKEYREWLELWRFQFILSISHFVATYKNVYSASY